MDPGLSSSTKHSDVSRLLLPVVAVPIRTPRERQGISRTRSVSRIWTRRSRPKPIGMMGLSDSVKNGLRDDSPIPLYVQLGEILRRQIVSGLYAPGEQLPTEKEFCERYGVSTITVRQAVLNLVDEGLLYRRRGKGTFVAEPKLSRDISTIYSFSEDMKRLGLRPSSRVLDLRLIEADEVKAQLSLPGEGEHVFLIVRLRLADGTPLLLETTYIPSRIAPGLMGKDLSGRSLYAILKEDYGVEVSSAVESFESVILDAEEAELLGCPAASAAFHIERTAYDPSGVPVELTSSLTRADRCKFSITWGASSFAVERELSLGVREASGRQGGEK